MDLRGKRVLLTGASSGIGEAAAEKFADAGATVIAVARRQELLDALAARITGRGGDAQAVSCDLSDLDAIDDPAKTVGPVAILINNAGRAMAKPVEHIDLAEYTQLLDLNVVGPLRLMQLVIPTMRAHGAQHGLALHLLGIQRVAHRDRCGQRTSTGKS